MASVGKSHGDKTFRLGMDTCIRMDNREIFYCANVAPSFLHSHLFLYLGSFLHE